MEYGCLCTLSKIFNANNDRRTVVKHHFEAPITAVALRFHPTAWSGDMCMRVEAFGCDGEYIDTCCLPFVIYTSIHIQVTTGRYKKNKNNYREVGAQSLDVCRNPRS